MPYPGTGWKSGWWWCIVRAFWLTIIFDEAQRWGWSIIITPSRDRVTTFFCQLEWTWRSRVSSLLLLRHPWLQSKPEIKLSALDTRHVVGCWLLGGATLYLCQSATVKLIFDEGLERYMQAVLIHACQHDIFYGMHSQCLITMNVCSQLVLVEATAGNAIKLSLS